ncbi:ABC transporter substrate-binding protein [Roseibaca sp. Y0-43]|uniref:ABC transporter substrate-binding protein n=1 Tax=Roseibaca sp. Y0-43 TaxID=2816854 RepID=UPI001D0BF75E|nr:substrate-binding domain-containing protein [Roseibaca sp. Y0-43]MCC1480920.1 ABC transporter substrate-binding protein [Roseibaca sp. Y0-43]
MRLVGLALGLMLALAAPLLAQEIEDHRVFPGTGPQLLRVLSTTDLSVFEPYIRQFQRQNPEIGVDYTVMSSATLHRAVREGAQADLVMSSAMDLQFQLVNDGFAGRYTSDAVLALPDWARWRDLIFAFTTEPAVVVINSARFAGLPLPATRQELITLLREHPERFMGAIGTYDVRDSGLGYLFATQEDRSTDAFWRLNEVLGRLEPKLYCCSAQMIEDVADGRLALAYNVLGSYAAEELARGSDGRVQILRMQDFANAMLRTVFMLKGAENRAAAGAMIDMLAGLALRDAPGDWPLPPLGLSDAEQATGLAPIRLGPALLTYLDPLNRRAFLAEWGNALEQGEVAR